MNLIRSMRYMISGQLFGIKRIEHKGNYRHKQREGRIETWEAGHW